MSRSIRLICFVVLAAALAACANPQPAPIVEPKLPNPASVFCEENGGVLEIRQDTDGNQFGVCVFPDGSECDEWAFYRGECAPKGAAPAGEEADKAPVEEPQATVELTSDGWKIYRHAELGYSFAYPPEASIVEDDNPLKSFSIVGPVVNGDRWPFITISHPADREEYQPPENADLEQWLTDHNLIGDTRQPDLEIAGVPAVHLRHERSPQSYAYDRYYFAHQGQLYMIVIGHTGDKEDWELYNKFLESFQF
jgi:putative hemolysin